VTSTSQLERKVVNHAVVDVKPSTWKFRARTELGQRLRANECEWCGATQGRMEVHHVRKLADLKGKALWERQMIARQRKTMVLCKTCHDDLHAGRLGETTRAKGQPESRIHGNV
jgi:aminoglycoside phosphotransferase family enzyme